MSMYVLYMKRKRLFQVISLSHSGFLSIIDTATHTHYRRGWLCVCESHSLSRYAEISLSLSAHPSITLWLSITASTSCCTDTQVAYETASASDVWYHSNREQPMRGLLRTRRQSHNGVFHSMKWGLLQINTFSFSGFWPGLRLLYSP